MLAEQSARLQPESAGADKTAFETRMQPVKRTAPVQPVQHETRVQPVRRAAPVRPVQRETRVQVQEVQREAPLHPVPLGVPIAIPSVTVDDTSIPDTLTSVTLTVPFWETTNE